jgi:ABC-type branched-subunit amino acid transport system substrate-binding protein
VSYTAGSGDYRAELLRLIGSKVDLLVLVPTAKESLALIYRQMAELNWLPVLVGDVNLCDYQPLPTDFGLRGYCWRAVLDTEGFFSFVEKFEKRYQEAPQFPYYDALTYDSVSLLDRALMNLGPKATATEVAQHLLAGGVGSITSYQFEPNGEILGGGNFLKKIEF